VIVVMDQLLLKKRGNELLVEALMRRSFRPGGDAGVAVSGCGGGDKNLEAAAAAIRRDPKSARLSPCSATRDRRRAQAKEYGNVDILWNARRRPTS